jgi:hypothetical protein
LARGVPGSGLLFLRGPGPLPGIAAGEHRRVAQAAHLFFVELQRKEAGSH